MKKLTAIVLAVSLGGCANVDLTREELLGAAAGAAVGGIVGYQFGGGVIMNSLFATAGTLAGGTAGLLTTRALMGSDLASYDRTTRKALVSATNGAILDWQNPETGNSGIVRPMNSFTMADGRLCRQYRATVSFAENVRSGQGMACRNADGRWQVVSDDFRIQG
ncbi:MAG: RT0821/Lpp0805 family surface protein [Rhodospirillales bacterium]